MTNLTVLEGQSRQLAGFAVQLGRERLVYEYLDLDFRKPRVLLLPGDPEEGWTCFPNRRAAQDAVATTREQAIAEGYERDTAAYKIIPVFTSK